MVYLGTTHRGDPVYMNKYVFECDIQFLSVMYREILMADIQVDTNTVQQVSLTGDVSQVIMYRLLCTEMILHRLMVEV